VAVAIFAEASTPVNATEQARFKPLYARMLRALKLQGVAEKTVDAYARAPSGEPPSSSIAVRTT
jgi:hypothetical protein